MPRMYCRKVEATTTNGTFICYEICVINKFRLRYFLPSGRLIWGNDRKTKDEIFYHLFKNEGEMNHIDISMNPYELSKLEESIKFFSNQHLDMTDTQAIRESLTELLEVVGDNEEE